MNGEFSSGNTGELQSDQGTLRTTGVDSVSAVTGFPDTVLPCSTRRSATRVLLRRRGQEEPGASLRRRKLRSIRRPFAKLW